MRSRASGCLVGLFLIGVGCAGGPKYRIDDALLADVPVSEKQAMLGAKAEIDQAIEEKRKAEADLLVIERDLSVAESEYGQAKLEVEKTDAELKLAEQSKDVNRVSAAREQLKRTKLGKDIADAKVDWQKQRRRAGKSMVEVAERHKDAAEGRYEQEKARLAQQKGKKPSNDFNPMNYDQQAMNLQGKYDQSRIDANKETLTASQREQKHNQRMQEFQQSFPGAGPAGGAAPQGQPPSAYPAAPQGQPPPGNP